MSASGYPLSRSKTSSPAPVGDASGTLGAPMYSAGPLDRFSLQLKIGPKMVVGVANSDRRDDQYGLPDLLAGGVHGNRSDVSEWVRFCSFACTYLSTTR